MDKKELTSMLLVGYAVIVIGITIGAIALVETCLTGTMGIINGIVTLFISFAVVKAGVSIFIKPAKGGIKHA